MWLLVCAVLGILGIAGLAAWRGWWTSRDPVVVERGSPRDVGDKPAAGAPNVPALHAATGRADEMLWQLAYGAPAIATVPDKAHAEMRVAIVARLRPEKLDPDYLPRRPALLQQLLRVIDDPDAQADKLSRMIAHDPVLSADVLRIANSSLYRVTPEPLESIQRAIVVCGVDSLRGILATAMVRPVFRASGRNFPRLPRLLWERTERATRAAELYAMKTSPQDRFEAQLTVLLSALGPLVVHSAALDAYARRPRLQPDPSMLVELTLSASASLSERIAREWGSSPRIISVLAGSETGPLAGAVAVGEFLGSLATLTAHSATLKQGIVDWMAECAPDDGLIQDIGLQISRT